MNHINLRHIGNDPFDYEHKYSEDEAFKEMGPMARIWKVFLDECGKFDAEMAENWRDALDVLLVFVSTLIVLLLLCCSRHSILGWIVLGCRLRFRCSNLPGPQAQFYGDQHSLNVRVDRYRTCQSQWHINIRCSYFQTHTLHTLPCLEC